MGEVVNKHNNARKRESRRRIAAAFIELMRDHELNEVSVTRICEMADVNRSTFYSSYDDVYDLADKVLRSLMDQVTGLYADERERHFNSNDFSKVLGHIYGNQDFYRTCFKLGIESLPVERYDVHLAQREFGGEHVEYHIEFFRAGFNRVVRMWLEGGCKESPAEIEAIIKSEYAGRGA